MGDLRLCCVGGEWKLNTFGLTEVRDGMQGITVLVGLTLSDVIPLSLPFLPSESQVLPKCSPPPVDLIRTFTLQSPSTPGKIHPSCSRISRPSSFPCPNPYTSQDATVLHTNVVPVTLFSSDPSISLLLSRTLTEEKETGVLCDLRRIRGLSWTHPGRGEGSEKGGRS